MPWFSSCFKYLAPAAKATTAAAVITLTSYRAALLSEYQLPPPAPKTLCGCSWHYRPPVQYVTLDTYKALVRHELALYQPGRLDMSLLQPGRFIVAEYVPVLAPKNIPELQSTNYLQQGATPVPEPTSFALLLTSIGVLIILGRRRT